MIKRGRRKGSISEYLSLEDQGIIIIEEIAAVVSHKNEHDEVETVLLFKNSGAKITTKKPLHLVIRRVKSYLAKKARLEDTDTPED
jgi:hypothetical protein